MLYSQVTFHKLLGYRITGKNNISHAKCIEEGNASSRLLVV